MIQIDLGKRGQQRSSSSSGKGLGALLRKLQFGGGGNLGKYGKYLPFLIVSLMSYAPQWLSEQYKESVRRDYAQKIADYEEKIAQVNEEITKYAAYQKELESFETQKKLVREKMSVIQHLIDARSTPVLVFDSLGQNLPPRAWLTSIDFADTSNESAVKLQGQSYTNEDISDFVDRITESIHLTDVTLEEVISNKAEGNIEIKSFRLRAKPKVRALSAETPSAPPTPQPAPQVAKGGK